MTGEGQVLERKTPAGDGRQNAAAAEERLRKRSEADQRLQRAAFAQLAAVVEARPAAPLVQEGGEEPLFAACRLVADRMGIAVKPPAGLRGGKRCILVTDIARTSHFRTRRVDLAGPWWRRDNGPLLGFRAGDDSPVALLPTSPLGYELVDPVAGTRTAVTADVAGSLARFAHTFYRPLPAGVLGPWELFRFGLHHCGLDLRRVLLFALAVGLLGMASPIATGILFGTIVPESNRRQLLVVTMGLLVGAVAAALFQLSRDIALLRLEGKMGVSIESGIWDRLLRLPAPFFCRFAAGDLAVRATGIGNIRQFLSEVVVSSLFAGVFSLLNLGLLFCCNVRLALLACVLVVLMLGLIGLSVYLQLPLQRAVFTIRGKIAGMVLQFITGISRLRVAAAEERALARWASDFSEQKRFAYSARRVANHFAVVYAIVPLLSTLAVFATMAALGDEGPSLGMFLTFNAAFAQIVAALVTLGFTANAMLKVIPALERIQPILDALPEVKPAQSDAGELSGEIEISHVSFRYQADGPLILDDVSLQIQPGRFVAFVGSSGAGKSTILRLLLGFEAPQAGSLYFDRQDVAGLDLHSVRRQFGVVLQNGRLMSGNILTNILGSSLLKLENAWEAARLSGLDEDIRQMPMGMHTLVTEGGGTLSGGQRQRLMIARALVSKPRILLFDEATSALDNRTQAIVSRSLEELKATRIVVAHRLSTIRKADLICVLEGGRIVQRGTYEDLLRQGGLFGELVRRQLTGSELREDVR
jgi:NHLM bacteriocin system ABC transporter ATP-binding protein